MSKLKGITMQQQRKSVENGGAQHLHGSSIRKGIEANLDEFKYGFPADGLAVFFHKWWGSSNPDSTEDPRGDGGKDIQEDKSKGQESVDDGPNVSLIDAEKPHENSETNIDHQGTVLLSRVRRKAAEEGRKVLRLGVYRDSGINKLNRMDRKLLVQIFQSSLPSHLRHGLFES